MRPSSGLPRSTLVVLAAAALALTGCGSGGAETIQPAPPGSNAALYDALPESVREAGVIRFAGDSHPPYRTVGPDGSITGIDKDFQDALSRILGVRTETIIVDSLPAALQGMLSDRYDVFNGPVKVTAARQKQFDTVTWMTARTSYAVPVNTAEPITTADALCGKSVAVVTASIVEDQLDQLSAHCERTGRAPVASIALADTNATLLAARSGRAAAAGMTQAAAIDLVAKDDTYDYVVQTEQQGATADKLALYTAEFSRLGPVLDEAFQQLFADGTYQRIMHEWGLDDATVPAPEYNAGKPA
ncbi:ABC transporter substrate-binding protein [Saccharopolyspora gloriosae]|uniref:Polar amino acid transport system substrate-binding protein n=1 Tax=Saccharopolyspora gloriosae TaxID=455344 RepID=A0A840NDI9_9PSEU|nr:transporter substrate-binding domain-containing protein [Saccharopolyspora gloriosae]MBB5069021.1 polar amino acid transport system substrate-binding protein [Saccharopolyspora gloriosae]